MLLLPLLARAYENIDLQDLKGTLPTFKAIFAAILRRFGMASSVAAMDFYEAERAAAGITGKLSINLPGDIPMSAIDAAVDYATAPLWSPTKEALPQGGFIPDEQLAMDRLNAKAEQLVLDQSRQVVMDAVQKDKYARAWARVTEADACSFCLMLAMRGAVYKDQRSAGKGSNDLIRQNGKAFAAHYLTPSDFKVHDHCRCHVEPVFGIYEKSARVRVAEALWKKVVTDQRRSGNDARNAFRQAIEGRPITGSRRSKAARARTPEQDALVSEIKRYDALAKAALNSKVRAFFTERADELRKQLAGT